MRQKHWEKTECATLVQRWVCTELPQAEPTGASGDNWRQKEKGGREKRVRKALTDLLLFNQRNFRFFQLSKKVVIEFGVSQAGIRPTK